MLREVRIEVNSPCNFSCVHCYTDKRRTPLDEDHFARLIQEAAHRGVKSMSLTGGEPLLALERSLRLIRCGAESGLRVRLNTNGFLLNAEVISRLRSSGLDEAQISLNSADPDDFEDFVRRKGAFAAVIAGIRGCLRE